MVSLSTATPVATAIFRNPSVLGQVVAANPVRDVEGAADVAQALALFALHMPDEYACESSSGLNLKLWRERLVQGAVRLPEYVRRPYTYPERVEMEVRGLCESLSIYFPPALYADVAVRALQSAFTVHQELSDHQELSERKVRNSFEWMALLLCRYVLLNQPHSDEIWLPLIISAAPDNPYGPCLRALLLESGSAGNISVVQALAARFHVSPTVFIEQVETLH